MIDRFTSRALRKSPDQTVYGLNQLARDAREARSSLRVTSEDGSAIIIIGNQPTNPTTRKPYEFGVWKYAVKGDRLEPIGELQWN